MASYNEPVKVRTKKLGNGNESLFLDISYNGKRYKEYLKLYILADDTRAAKTKNKETMALANAIKSKRIVEIQEGRFGFESKERKQMLLLDFFRQTYKEVDGVKSESHVSLIRTVTQHLEAYIGKRSVTLKEADAKFVKGFIDYIRKSTSKKNEKFSQGSIQAYYTVFSIVINKAVRRGLIDRNPCTMLAIEDVPKKPESTREYLTIEEVKKLIDTECSNDTIRRMFLFSCFTGLRISDIKLLTWKNVVRIEDGVYQIETVQKKTKHKVVIPLTDNAMRWLPERRADSESVFNCKSRTNEYLILAKWTKDAGIRKKVTFHVARHTYATLLLYYGADVYTVSKLLGHTDVKITQIYAKVMDESKRKAVNLIPEI